MLYEVKDSEITNEAGYDIVEPTVGLELDGNNVFETFGISGVEHPVIMHSLEIFLPETLKLVRQSATAPSSEHQYWLLGTGFGLRVHRDGTSLNLFVDVDGRWGPVQGLADPQSKKVGALTVLDWVQGIVGLAMELIDLFKRFNPRLYSIMKNMESETQELRDWLVTSE